MESGGSVTVSFNARPRAAEARGFRIVITQERLTASLRDEELASTPPGRLDASTEHRLALATMGESYALWYDRELIAEGTMPPPFVDNEGWVAVTAEGATARITSFTESAIAPRGAFPSWRRASLLYRDPVSPQGFSRNWICNTEGSHAEPVLRPGQYTFRRMSNCLLRQRFQGPLAVDYRARPVPTDRFPAGVTDAIFIWMADHPDGELESFLNKQSRAGDASLKMLLPLPFYWVDFGGSNNVTTRLRKNPYRHMMRQYTDRSRLLRRNHTYDITVVQNGKTIEFWVDGSRMIQVYDPHPLTEGHVGVRAFCADLELTSLAVWRIAPR
jgi:hypothetical protein